MAVSTASAFRAGRKQSVSATTTPLYDHSNGSFHSPSTMNVPLPSPGPSSAAMQYFASSNGGAQSPYGAPSFKSSNDGGIGSSLISPSGGGGLGPGGAMLMSGAPIAANTIGNKPAVAGSSLYQACLTLRDRLWCVPDFGEAFLQQSSDNSNDILSTSMTVASSLGISFASTSPKSKNNTKPRLNPSDPVTQLWQCFRLGAPLCWLFNKLGPRNELPINPDANRSNANECKKQVAKFIMALNHELGWDPNDIFTISCLYLNDTNGFVKVIRTVSKLLDVFETRGLLMEAPTSAGTDELEKPLDDRAWIVKELLDTERKYVQDLEVMQNYARALAQNDILPPDTIHNLFGNLNTLVDVQRRFLICVEENVRRPADDQHFGHVFQTMEADFAVYEPFCANYAQALDIINAEAHNITRLRGLPAAEGCYLDPSYELPTFLIKPVQRICKYPLLLDQLLKKTAPEAPFYQELADGLQVIRRITDKVNETRRLQENIQLVRDLETRVEDWKGHSISTFGPLLLSDIFMVSKSDTEREYHVYLFEKIMLCCKEVLPYQPKKNSKSNSILKQKSQPNPTAPGKKPKTMLQLKGRIFINNVTGAQGSGKSSGQHALQVWWKGDMENESFSLRCKNEEQLRQWQAAIGRLMDDFSVRKQHLVAHYGQAGGMPSPGMFNMAGAGANGRRNTGGSLVQQSMFPQTPITDHPPFSMFARADSQASHRLVDDEQVEGMRDGMESGLSSGRGTPMGGRYSQPAEQRERQISLSADTRPRARTEDQDSHIMSQWRSNSPSMPPMPRKESTSSSSEVHYQPPMPPQQQQQQQQQQNQQLRKASSSKQMRQAYTNAHPRPALRTMDSGEAAISSDTNVGQVEQMENLYVSSGLRPKLDSTSNRGGTALEAAFHQQHSRSRSSSNPIAFAGLPGKSVSPQPPPIPRSNHTGFSNGLAPSSEQHTHYNAASMVSSRYASIERKGNDGNDKRFSSSSTSTDDSNQSSHSRPGSTAATSPMTHSTGALGGMIKGHAIMTAPRQNHSYPHLVQMTGNAAPHHQSSAVKLVIHHGEDKLVVVVLSTINLIDLTEKVSKKIRLISGRKGPMDLLRIRYIDEDGDKILMHDDEDVQMAFELSRNLGTDVNLVVA